jgi:hypothetical protein
MATVRSVDFLPEIFQTDTNKQFLAATLDQLVQEPKFKKTQGFIGRRVGPGVNPNDRYVVEIDPTRTNYQLEPGVVSLKPDTTVIKDVITYPGMNDAVTFQGGNGARPDRLYESEYYTWDPFVNFDAFVNFSQYFWLPNGPDPVNVRATGIPISANFEVTRENGVYTFSDASGNNPTIDLVRGGSYTFSVAQNNKETINFRVKNSTDTAYVIDGQRNPTLTLARGNTYVFNLTVNGVFPFWIKTEPTTGVTEAYSEGVLRNGAATGLVTFTVPRNAPDTLYYIAENRSAMQGVFNIVDSVPGTGPGFWIQTAPGVSGTLPTTPNISSRDVFGVLNNGEDLGVVTFNVPYKESQNFFYNLTSIGTVDLLTTLKFNQINNAPLDQFNATYGGIDGITDLNGRTLVFTNPETEVEAGGWEVVSLFDPLVASPTNNGLIGSFDTTTFSQTTPVPLADRYQIWQINYTTNDDITYITLNKITDIDPLEKWSIKFGAQYANTQWYKDVTGFIKSVPLLSAAEDILYYQDGTDPEIFGRIKLVEQTQANTIFIDEILGKSTYTSPNGIAFTNGLKVRFTGDVSPASYASNSVTIAYTATEAGTNYITAVDDTDQLYVGQQIIFNSPTLGGLVSGQSYYVRSIAANGLKFTVSSTVGGVTTQLQNGTGNGTATAISNREYYVAGVGTAIELLPVINFVVPETYATDFDTATVAVEPGELDYLTIDRASKDLNPWTRSNRWFHLDVINATATYNDTVAVLDNIYRAKRPIVQFRPGLRLWNMGTEGKQPVDIIDFEETDAFSNIEGATSYSVDGYDFVEGTRVIFAADNDTEVRNKIYVVSFVIPDSQAPLIDQPIINLTLDIDGEVLVDQNTVILFGDSTQGKTYWYDGVDWIDAQQKTAIQQAPLFNVYDGDGISFGDIVKYQSSNFVGSKLFSYALSDTTLVDPVLQFSLEYLNIENVGDIVFENNLYVDSFVYVVDNASVTLDISSGAAREYASRTVFQKRIGWQNAVVDSKTYQQFQFNFNNQALVLDVAAQNQTTSAVPVIKIYVGAQFLAPTRYTYTTTGNSTEINLLDDYPPDEIIEVLVLSSQTSATAFYQVPINLESNPLNANSPRFTLGTVRTHYQSICENLTTLSGPVNGANNTRDLGNIIPYGLVILQQSAPLTLAGYFMRSQEYNIFAALKYNSQEYLKYKAQLMDAVLQQNISFKTTGQILDTAIQDVTLGKVESQPFYWSDMLPSGIPTYSNSYTVGFTTSPVFDTVQIYNYESSNYLGLLVYKSGILLTRGTDYVVAVDGPRITITVTLTVGDVIQIDEYASTYGNFVPNTPTKVGLYPAWRPGIVPIRTSTTIKSAILGHDGSTTPLFGDLRDQVLLEFETRIYNNLKLDGNPVPLIATNVLSGQFRDTGFTYAETNNILAQDLLSYCGWNKLDFRTQQYDVNNPFTYNYSGAQNRLDNQPLLGAWRGIYRFTYDVEQPQYTPWEMLGFSVEPTWWEDRYGPAPYTSDNLVLWDDLEAGYVADPVAPYILPEYVRPGLTTVLPTGSEGELLSPNLSVMGFFNETQFQKSWALGDGGPVEASWWNSSAYPFAVMRLLALTRPAKFFALFADRDRYKFNLDYQQYLYDERYRLDANGIQVYGNGVSKASYINWIVDYNRLSGLDSTQALTDDLANLDVRLCYRMASFSDKQYIKVVTEKSSPSSTNTALVIPDESYDLLVYKNQTFGQVVYSGVTVQKTNTGAFSVVGYGTQQPYFNVLQSRIGGKLTVLSLGDLEIQVPTLYSSNVVQVPYGTVFANASAVVDFLLSYGKYLESQGLTFTSTANGYVLDWTRMAYEFLYWAQQGWSIDAIINLNPLADKLTVTREKAVVDSIRTQTVQTQLLDQNSQDFATRNLNIVRIDNTFTVQSLAEQTINYAELSFTSFEHLIVLSNQSVFGDLIYDPTTGDRQSRLNLIAITTVDWNGTVNAPGFILNQNNVEEWTGLRTYAKGEIVRYKNVFWSALTIVQPSERFNFNDWVQSDYEQIQLGLLPNIANKADQLANSYNINVANIESDNDLLSFGLIGFRPRQYMAALNLDDVSQVNVYRQFLGTKGTVQAAELFKGANFSKETADYDIYENWAVQRAVYGANANRSFVELRLNRGLLNSNPSIVKVTTPQETSEADQNIQLGAVWRQSYKLTSPAFLPVTTELPTDIGLPTAGYVSLDDADITIFDIEDNQEFAANIDQIQTGTSLWVAKINSYDWNIYRAQPVPGTIVHVCDNLDTTSRVIFSAQHGLIQGQKLIIKQFDDEVDGVYTVVSVLNPTTVNIEFQFVGDRTVADGDGIGFTLQTQRVAQASDVLNLPYTNQIQAGARVWADDDGTGHWAVFEKQDPFTSLTVLGPDPLTTLQNENYGHSVAQAINRFALLVGAPFYTRSAIQHGGVYVYVKSDTEEYTPVTPLPNSVNAVLTLDVTGVRGYGNAVDFGNQTWAVAGASRSLGPASEVNNGYAAVIYRDPDLGQPGVVPFAQWQLLTLPDTTPSSTPGAGEFGYSVVMSTDERWMYISAPGLDEVYGYGRVDWQHQFVEAVGNGTEDTYFIADQIQIDQDTQILVTLDGTKQFVGVDYTVDGTFENVIFTSAPGDGVEIRIQRINQQLLDYDIYYGVTQSATSGSGINAEFTIERVRGEVGQPGADRGFVGVNGGGSGYVIGNTITINATSFGGGVNGVNNIVLTVTAVSGTGALQAFTIAYTPPALQTVFDLGQYFFTATNIYSFSVLYEGIILRPNIDYSFNVGTQDLTFTTIPSAGSEILVRAESYFRLALALAGPTLGERFGESISCSTDGRQLLVGVPDATVYSAVEAGTVYVYDRNVQRFIVQADADNPTFTVLGSPVAPIGVTVNNERWTNEVDSVIGGLHTFTWNGTTSVTLNGSVSVGDEVEIETNQFTLLDQLHQQTVAEFSNFGFAVDLCENNCSVYVGEPNSSVQIFKGGIVERSENQARIYGTITSTVASPTLVTGDTLRVNNIDVAVPAAPNDNIEGLATAINQTVPNVVAVVNEDTGLLTISVANSDAAPAFNKLNVAPGSVGNTFIDLGFEIYVWVQNILSPFPVEFANFGSSISIDTGAENLVVGAPRGTLYLITEFDNNTTIFDIGSTVFFSVIVQSGSVYTYDYLPSASASIFNPGQFVFGQQLGDNDIKEYDLFGYSVNYTSGVLAVGAPASDLGDSSSSDYGSVSIFINPDNTPAWQIIKLEQPVVDVRLLNSVFLYDSITSATTEFLDFINPLQGKILGAARQNLDYIGAVDPAAYNAGTLNVTGATWGASHVGEMWWDTSTVRFIDPNQDSLIYASRRWSQVFPGSTVAVYQWVKSFVPPADYAGEGVPRNTVNYSINTRLSLTGLIETEYYFWVQGITTIATNFGKTLPTTTVANYIADPKASGIAYLAAINASTVALYNCLDLIEAADTILHIEYDRELTSDNVHVEYDLIPQDRADGFVSDNIYRKMQDSFCGVDTAGNLVPDFNLGPAEKYGIQFRPRQSMFVDRFEALKNYLSRANSVLRLYPIVENRNFNLLLSSQPIPSVNSGLWDLEVANLEILGFQNIYTVPFNYRYLVLSDSSNGGRWSIYQVNVSELDANIRELTLYLVQTFVTPDYWNYIDWYLPGYNSSTQIIAEVNNVSDLDQLDLPVGSSVRLTANSQGKFEIYQRRDTGWIRVGLEDGTIEFKAELWDYQLGRFGFDIEVFDAQYFDQEPVIETRKIIQAINEELFIDDLAIERNRLLMLVFDFVLSEFSAPEWLVKTSLIDVDHRLRDLVPFQNYIRDNQEFVEQYIQEVKPYHVQIREFNLKYNGVDDFLGDIADFDLPAYFNTTLEIPKFTSPILLPYAVSTSFNAALTLESNLPATSSVWQTWPYSAWIQNYLLNLDDIEIVDGGVGYNEPPTVQVVGDAVIPCEATCTINTTGQVVSVNIIVPGVGYSSTPEVQFIGGNGTGARAYARMTGSAAGQDFSESTVPLSINTYFAPRIFRTTLRFDRFQYQPSVVPWSPQGNYQNGDLVRYNNEVYAANSQDSTAVDGPVFDLADWTLVNPGTYTYPGSSVATGLTGVDRTMGLYVPSVNAPGLELPLLIDGVDYPGVQVYGLPFLGDPALLDAEYRSAFNDIFLGQRISDINVEGGDFVGPYEGHAPEELVNGSEFDTLDFKVFTRPGSDWNFDGHGFQLRSIRYVYDTALLPTYSYANLVENVFQILVSNVSTGLELYLGVDYTIDWVAQDITIEPTSTRVSTGNILNITVYEIGGGSQLFRANYISDDINGVSVASVIVPVSAAEISELAAFNDATPITGITFSPYIDSTAWSITNSYLQNDVVNNVVSSVTHFYRALQNVPVGIDINNAAYWFEFVPTLQTLVDFNVNFPTGHSVALAVLGPTTPIQYSWSTPVVQQTVATQEIVDTKLIDLDNFAGGTNPANLILIRNGLRLRPAEGIEWIGDGTTDEFGLPQRGNYSQEIINSATDITVWVNGILQIQTTVGPEAGNYFVTPWDGSNVPGRQVSFFTAPPTGSRVLIAVSTQADYVVQGSQLEVIAPINLGDEFEIITWNNTQQQNIVTQVFKGPVITGITITEPYDSTPFDQATINANPGSYDYTVGVGLPVNDFFLDPLDSRGIIDAGRLWVTLDGQRLFEGEDYSVENDQLILPDGAIGADQVVVVTQFTNSVVPESMAFRIFQDMRGVQATYRITAATSTVLAQELLQTDTVIFVQDAAALAEPDLENGIFGIITIDGERIMYRERNLANNSLTSLLRGTGGTGAADHAVGTDVYDLGRGNLLFPEYQDYVVSTSTLGDGVTTVYIAPNIDLENIGDSSTAAAEAIEVYVGGTRQYAYSDLTAESEYRWFVTDFGPLTVEFVVDSTAIPELRAPADGSEVTLLVRRGVTWYAPGDGTPSDGVALQDTNTLAARFLRGL